MKKLLLIIICLTSLSLYAQEKSDKREDKQTETEQTEPKGEKDKKDKIKTGWNFGPLPAVAFNSDLGFQYGVLCDIFYFGDGSTYPHYLHKFNAEISRFTGGEWKAHVFYDSKYLIPKIRFTFATTYMDSSLQGFYGFNGFSSPYNKDLAKSNPSFYAMERTMLRIICDFHGLFTDNFGWVAGLTFWDIHTAKVGLEEYADEGPSLYELYRTTNLIQDNEIGGSNLEIKAGLVYDTRDLESAPSKGFCAELIAIASPDIFNKNGYHYGKIFAQWRQYITLLPNRLVFAYRLAYQGTIGNAPFYMQQNITTLYLRQMRNEGLGGMNTVRGIMQNRIVANGYAWANFEARIKLFDFRLINQNWYVAVNPFFDMGIITQTRDLEEMKNAHLHLPDTDERALIYNEEGKPNGLHMSAGMGAKLAMNQNFIISVEVGVPFDKQDGNMGTYIVLNYIF